MTTLKPMGEQQFVAFAEECIARYASDNVQAGRWSLSSAPERGRLDFERLLPLGLQTPDHFLYEIVDEALGLAVGSLWFAIVHTASDARSGFIYYIWIRPELRGRGYAKAALEAIEAVASDHGLATIALHVFSFNTTAQALYRSVGYGITGMNMQKPLMRGGR
jgi:ribosomal protein S18 acetylase RimI-like enzyme